MTGLRLEPLTEGHLGGVHRLHREVFRTRLSLDELRRKYDTSWAGLTGAAIVAGLGDRTVAFYGAVAQRFRRGDERFTAVQTCDSIVAAEQRGRGLHGTMARACYDLLRRRDVPFVYALHSAATLGACRPLGWQLSHHLELFQARVATPPVAALAARSDATWRAWRWWWQRACQALAAPAEDFRSSFAVTDRLHVDYAPDYLAYRCFSLNALLRLGSATAWVRGGGSLWVGDLQAPDDDAHDRAVDSLVVLARRVGSRRLVFQTSPGGPLSRRLRRRFEARQGFPIGYLPLADHVEVEPWGCNLGDLDTF